MENICKNLKTFHRKLRTLLLVLSRNFCIDLDGKIFARHNNPLFSVTYITPRVERMDTNLVAVQKVLHHAPIVY